MSGSHLAVDAGCVAGQKHMTIHLLNGTGVAALPVQVVSWSRRAAEGESNAVMRMLHICYRDGVGEAEDAEQTLVCLRQADDAVVICLVTARG